MSNPFTLLIAHPDDEVLWMWPVLVPGMVKRIVCLSSDADNPERKWCRNRKSCLEEIGKRVGAEVICFDYNSEFYRLPTRDGSLKKLAYEALGYLEGPVFTHNAWGEYGNIDHILCHQIAQNTKGEVWSTDIAQEVNWLPVRQGAKYMERVRITPERFAEFKAIYDKRGCWTWSHAPELECGMGLC